MLPNFSGMSGYQWRNVVMDRFSFHLDSYPYLSVVYLLLLLSRLVCNHGESIGGPVNLVQVPKLVACRAAVQLVQLAYRVGA